MLPLVPKCILRFLLAIKQMNAIWRGAAKVGFIRRYIKKIQVMLFISVPGPVLWARGKEATPVGVFTLGPQTSNGASIWYSRDLYIWIGERLIYFH